MQPLNLLHKNGLYQLGYAFVELVIQHLLQRTFWHSKSSFHTLPIYGILDLGFDELSENKNHPAGMLLRRAHRRPKKSGGLFAYGSTGQLVQLEAERLLRRYGITSVNNITTIRVWQENGDLRIQYGEQEIDFLNTELADATALRSKLDGQQGEIESIKNRLGEKQQAAKGAEEREFELHQELTGMAVLNKDYSELLQDYAYLQSRFNDSQSQLKTLEERNFQLQKSFITY